MARAGKYKKQMEKVSNTSGAQDANRPDGGFSGIVFAVSLVVTMMFISVVILSLTPTVTGKSLWLVSRASATTAYIDLTGLVILGIVLSHPRNKDSWHLHRHLLGWHQALVGVLFPLLAIHIAFTVLDSRSGVTLAELPFPIHARYYPAAMTAGAAALYILLLVAASAGLRRKFRKWLAIHRLSLITWVLVWTHGVFGGTDAGQLEWLYLLTGCAIFIVAVWRYWVQKRGLPVKRQPDIRQQASQ